MLRRLVPTHTAEPLGIDLERGWVLLRDGGRSGRPVRRVVRYAGGEHLEPFGGATALRVGAGVGPPHGRHHPGLCSRVLDVLEPGEVAEYRTAPLRWLSYLLVADPYGGPGCGSSSRSP